MTNKKILITGVAGFMGSHLADALLAKGHVVVGVDNLIGGYLDNVPKGVEFHELDCSNLNEMNKIMPGVDIVYHTACTAHEGLSVFSPELITRNTFGNSLSVISSAISNNVKRFIYCSSMARYGTQEITPFTEDMIPKPQDPYGISKYAVEQCLHNLSETHGMEYVIAVPHNIIGPRQKYDDPFRNVAGIMINLMLQNRQPFIYGNGSQTRCFSFIQDVIDPLIEMATNNECRGQVINIGPDKGTVTILELAETIAKLLNFELKPNFMPDRPREVKHASCSADKVKKLLNFESKISLEEGLSEMIDYIKKRGAKTFEYHLNLEIISDITPKTWKDRLF